MKEKIAKWYKQGLWSKKQVADAIGKSFDGVVFTAKDYENITGEAYEA